MFYKTFIKIKNKIEMRKGRFFLLLHICICIQLHIVHTFNNSSFLKDIALKNNFFVLNILIHSFVLIIRIRKLRLFLFKKNQDYILKHWHIIKYKLVIGKNF